ncbi:hypothetical protein [Cupriavidus numazuensis]|uniref:Uncharacterized protein n=1 Tax=Cupriavidus numazuensis TaxID=221992 RepID=A0ABM8T9K4_9BURK|nr:hypothetical protein [Cupriavidus numazuensis]CAG2129377.1 hypothetical protein LMG26411_00163 [Cupriavidus numazuensis]
MSLPPIGDWEVDALRLIFFTQEPSRVEGAGYFRSLTGADPESVLKKPHVAEYSEIGPCEDNQLEIKGGFNRTELTLSAIPKPGPTAPSLGKLVDRIEPFVEKFGAWFSEAQISANRIALAVGVWRPTEGRVASNTLIHELAHFAKFDPAAIRDVALQFNYATSSSFLPSVELNRMVRLLSLEAKMLEFSPSGTVSEHSQCMCRVELDFNTSEACAAEVLSSDASRFLPEFRDLILSDLAEGFK